MIAGAARFSGLGLAVIALAGCQPGASPAVIAPVDRGSSLAFAQGACGGCHAVEADWLSPNEAAPSFANIANREGLTAGTLAVWLRDAHNYPEAMDFDLTPARVEELTAYILTLRDPAYRPTGY